MDHAPQSLDTLLCVNVTCLNFVKGSGDGIEAKPEVVGLGALRIFWVTCD